MRTFKFFWTTHKWTGIIISAILSMSAVTGFLLLIKKEVGWIQPPTQMGAAGTPESFVTIADALESVYALGRPEFRTADDIDRIDVRVGKRVYKVRSKHGDVEAQVDAVTGEVMGVAVRRSDLLERIHDGSFFGDWAHDWVMPAVAVLLMFLVCSGLWLWLEPKWRRRVRRRTREAG
jgi:uncharacterized iron-regulated membrane protein